MTATGIKKAFRNLDPSDQAKVLTELAATLAQSLSDRDEQDAAVVRVRRREERSGAPLSVVKRRKVRDGHHRAGRGCLAWRAHAGCQGLQSLGEWGPL